MRFAIEKVVQITKRLKLTIGHAVLIAYSEFVVQKGIETGIEVHQISTSLKLSAHAALFYLSKIAQPQGNKPVKIEIT